MRYKRRISTVASILIFCFLTACDNVPHHPDPNHLGQADLWDSEDCMIGCWRGLIPGLSSEQEVQDFFESNMDASTLYNGQSDDFNWYNGAETNPSQGYYVRTRVVDDLLWLIWVDGPFNLTIAEILERFGEPQLFEVGVMYYGVESSLLEAHIYFHYPEAGFSFFTYHWGGNIADGSLEICLQANYAIYDFFVYQPNPSSEFAPEAQYIHSGFANMIKRDWQGYSCFVQDW
jgi:hypothetical protein